ncbi:unnamed protein product, partial [Rotaria sp. Silwood1]
MRVIVLPVCQLESYPHVLLKYDFQINPLLSTSSDINKRILSKNIHSKEFYLTPYYLSILPSGSIQTVCEIIKNSNILRYLFNITNKDEENIENK